LFSCELLQPVARIHPKPDYEQPERPTPHRCPPPNPNHSALSSHDQPTRQCSSAAYIGRLKGGTRGTFDLPACSLRMSRPLQHQIISRALELIRNEAHWTRVYVARAANGKPCACTDDSATRFCAIGALAKAASELTG